MTDNFKRQWDVEMAMTVLENKTVDSKLWAEAVEWLLLYGPPRIKEILSQASSMATQEHFPELKPTGYSPDGQPCYDVRKLAEFLGLTPEDIMKKLGEMEIKQESIHLYSENEINKLQ